LIDKSVVQYSITRLEFSKMLRKSHDILLHRRHSHCVITA